MKDNLEKEAYRLRFEYFNTFEKKENKWHDTYKNHQLYKVVVKSFDYKFHEIGQTMPKLLEEINK